MAKLLEPGALAARKRKAALRAAAQPSAAAALLNSSLPAEAYGDPQVKSCIRVIELLNFFAQHKAPAKSTTIADHLGWPKSSAHELLKSLVDVGSLTFDQRTKSYIPAFSLVTLGASFAESYYGGDAILDVLKELHERTGELAALYMENNNCMQCLAAVPGKDFMPQVHGFGARVDMLVSSSGRACLATKPDQQVVACARWLTRHLDARRQDETVQSVLAAARQVRKQGYAVRERPYPNGLSGISIRLPVRSGSTPLFLGVGNHRIGEESRVVSIMMKLVEKYSA